MKALNAIATMPLLKVVLCPSTAKFLILKSTLQPLGKSTLCYYYSYKIIDYLRCTHF